MWIFIWKNCPDSDRKGHQTFDCYDDALECLSNLMFKNLPARIVHLDLDTLYGLEYDLLEFAERKVQDEHV